MKTALFFALLLSTPAFAAGKITCYVIDTAISDTAQISDRALPNGDVTGKYDMPCVLGFPVSVTLWEKTDDSTEEDRTPPGVYLTQICAKTSSELTTCSDHMLQFNRANGTSVRVACQYFQ